MYAICVLANLLYINKAKYSVCIDMFIYSTYVIVCFFTCSVTLHFTSTLHNFMFDIFTVKL